MNENSETIVHHLSDIHVGPLHFRAERKLRFVREQSKGWSNLKLYCDYLTREAERQSSREPGGATARSLPDVVVVSGDLTSYATADEFFQVEDALQTIVDLIADRSPCRGPDQPCLFLVPGNHDLDWSKEEQAAKLEHYARFSDRLPAKHVVSAVNHKDGRTRYVDLGDQSNLLIYLFNSCPLGGIRDPELAELKRAFEYLVGGDSKHDEALAAFEKLIRQDPGFVDLEAYSTLDRELEGHAGRIKIAVVHHNPASVPSDDVERYDTIINAGRFKSTLVRHGFDLVLHGHRHLPHLSYEEHFTPLEARQADEQAPVWQRLPYQQGVFVLGGDTLGSKEGAPFFELRISDAGKAHNINPPSSLVRVREARHNPRGYSFHERYQLLIDKPSTASLRFLQQHLNRSVLARRDEMRAVLDQIGPSLRRLQAEVDDWSEGDDWFATFQSYVDSYSFVAATDMLGPQGWLNARYLHHVIVQNRERQKRSLNPGRPLRFSKPVLEAIRRTDWDPEFDVRRGSSESRQQRDSRLENAFQERNELDDGELEVVRILFWKKKQIEDERAIVDLVDSLHSLCAVPVFVLSPDHLEDMPNDYLELLIGLSTAGEIHHAYGLRRGRPTSAVSKQDGEILNEAFLGFLKAEDLVTLQSFRGSPG